jgi:hypothetical protein
MKAIASAKAKFGQRKNQPFKLTQQTIRLAAAYFVNYDISQNETVATLRYYTN